MIVGHRCLTLNHWTSSSMDRVPSWSISSTSKHKSGRYIYMSKGVCKKCYDKNQKLSNK